MAVPAPSGKEASLRGQTDDLQLLEKVGQGVEVDRANSVHCSCTSTTDVHVHVVHVYCT